MTTATVGYLTLQTVSGETRDHALLEVDVAIVFAGWESRVLETAKLSLRAARVLCVSWLEAQPVGWHATVQHDLIAIARKWTTGVDEMALRMYSDASEGLRVLMAYVVDAYVASGRPLRVFLDISNCPELFSVGLFAAATRLGCVEEWCFFYAEAEYTVSNGSSSFTRGDWNVTPVPHLRQPVDPERSTCLVLGLGFEGEKARQLMVRYEPDCLYLLLPSPGFSEDYTSRAERENHELLDLVRSREVDQADMLLTAPAGDGAAAAAALVAALPTDDSANFLFVPTGPKPHALGMAAFALNRRAATVLYRNPEKFEIRDTLNTGRSWLLTITDRSLPGRRR